MSEELCVYCGKPWTDEPDGYCRHAPTHYLAIIDRNEEAIDALRAELAALREREKIGPLELATFFHETYERLAPSFGYETRQDTRRFDETSKNGRLMVAVCEAVIDFMRPLPAPPEASE